MEKVSRKQEYLLRLSDGSTIRVLKEHLTRSGLEEGRPLGEDTRREIADSYEYAKAREIALRLLKTRPRTEEELKRRFRKSDLRVKIWERVLDDLKDEGQVDDRVFAQLWIREKIGRAGSGRKRIASDLRSKGIDRTIVEEEIARNYDDADETEIAKRLAIKRLGRLKSLPAGVARRRIYGLLLRRGFQSDVASAALEAALETASREETT
ncbi:MAG: regulatory protein RecX [Candidatus Eisenbacteria bacterium]